MLLTEPQLKVEIEKMGAKIAGLQVGILLRGSVLVLRGNFIQGPQLRASKIHLRLKPCLKA